MSETNIRLPSNNTLQHASKIAIVEDRPIMLDYWAPSLEQKVLIGVREDGEKLIVKVKMNILVVLLRYSR